MKPFPFQEVGSSWLAGPTARPYRYLADEMGLGKSVQAIRALRLYSRNLVICPATLRTNWAREVAKWAPAGMKQCVVLERLSDRPNPGAPFSVCSYEYATAREDWLSAVGFDTMILDEAHYVGRRDAQRTDAIFGRDGTTGIARNVGRVWWLSGTPILTSPADLWLPFRFSGHTGMTYAQWLAAFCDVAFNGRELRPVGLKASGAAELQSLIRNSGFVLRRLKEDVLKDMPRLFYQHSVIDPELSPMDASTHDPMISLDAVELERRLVQHAMHNAEFRTDEMRTLQSLAESCSTLRRYLGMQKVGPATALVAAELEANAYPKILMSFEHRLPLEAAAHRLARFGVGMIHGDVPERQRYATLDTFNAGPGSGPHAMRVLLMQTRAGGVGINATGADQVLVVECPWTPALLQQLVARCHRIGQTRAVTARVLSLSTEPMDEAIVRLVIKRARDIKEVLGDGK